MTRLVSSLLYLLQLTPWICSVIDRTPFSSQYWWDVFSDVPRKSAITDKCPSPNRLTQSSVTQFSLSPVAYFLTLELLLLMLFSEMPQNEKLINNS